ncbi:MAG: helix-turn-helix domain-containing protein [Egibacteraceae bacterium]
MHRRYDRTIPTEAMADLTSCGATGEAMSLARAALARVRLASGDAANCVEEIVDACGGCELPALHPVDRAEAYEALVQVELAHAQADAADRWAERAQAAAADLGLHAPTGFALLAQARSLMTRDPVGAAQHALAAAEAFAQAGKPLEEGRARLLAGSALAAADDRARALGQLDRAEALFASCGARKMAERAACEQRRLGRRGSRDGHAASAVLSLSDRELEIARLVAQGDTNRQIARQLNLSGKTVETYLSRIFVKLGVSSRAVVAAMVTRAQASA